MLQNQDVIRPFRTIAASLLLAVTVANLAHAAAKPSLSIKSAAYNPKTASLVVKTNGNVAHGVLSLIHSKGGVLGQSSESEHIFTIPHAQLGEIPCQVEARVGELKVSKAVSGASAECKKVPVCKLLTPTGDIAVNANTPTRFEAQVALKDKTAAPLTIEWDFAGGAMSHPYQRLLQDGKPVTSGNVSTEVSFVRDDTRYHVRFVATDALGHRCESGVFVDVGHPPSDIPNIVPLAQAAQAGQPSRASGLNGVTAVLPFEKRSMQCGHEAELMPATYMVAPPNFNTINAYVYEKGLRPVPLGKDRVELMYTAASNAADPVGGNSINSTSQSWPLGQPNVSARLKKGELFERYQRPLSQQADGYYSRSLIEAMSSYYEGTAAQHKPLPDEGAYQLSIYTILGDVAINPDHGRYMPGIDAPYSANNAQAFSEFNSQNNWFAAYWLPLTNIDDSGRVHPTSLFKVQAVDKDNQTPLAATDVSVTSGKDFHCRECHALGKIGANPNIKRTNATGSELMLMPAASDNIEDQEYAALQNMSSLHWFNDMPTMNMSNMPSDKPVTADIPNIGCATAGMCHGGGPTTMLPDLNTLPNNYARTRAGTSASVNMHRLHGALQYNVDKSDILRDGNGRYLCLGTDKSACLDASKSLFPVKDVNGKILPMEENCLKCHAGQREQCYRDRMYTAGVTCYQCHGDMLAVGQVYPKSRINSDGNDHRMHWLEQPDCGSCHTGSGNVGKDGSKGYFSAGVKTLAFAENDPSATPNAVDQTNPDQRRFAVPQSAVQPFQGDYNPDSRSSLYRLGKDAHGQVACAACHGPAHGIWPNRDPNANDNLTSLELQGHTGSLLDCNVCHKPDSFANFIDIDDGLKVIDKKEGILGGPHSLHPINDPFWWKTAVGDTPNADGSRSGGWHNNYAKIAGKADEDQCAACHGNDHKGTRLSKTPVDRVFDFSDLADLKLLKKAGIKPKVTVKAGTPIGCDTCHTVSLSCKASPNQDCGHAFEQTTGSSNQAPVLSPDIINVLLGSDFSQQLGFFDPEGDAVTSSLVKHESGAVYLDSQGMLTLYSGAMQQWAGNIGLQANPNNPLILLRPPFNYSLPIVLADARGAEAVRDLTIRMNCPDGQTWDQASWQCGPLTIYSIPPAGGIDGGSDWNYQVLAESGSQQALSYSLLDSVPSGMSIDNQGKISWHTTDVPNAVEQSVTVMANDVDGDQAYLSFSLTVCQPPMHWDVQANVCVGSVHITSQGPSYANANYYQYQLTYTENHNQPVSFSLINPPLGFEISPQGLITGDPSLTNFGSGDVIGFTVQVSAATDNWARQDVYVYSCVTGQKLNASGDHCVDGPIQFADGTGSDYASVDQVYVLQTLVSDSNQSAMTYSLIGALPGMTIDSQSGLVSWNSTGYTGQTVNYGIAVSDGNGDWTAEKQYLTVCPSDQPFYDSVKKVCHGPVHITSTQPVYGLNVGETFSYQVIATDTDLGGLPIIYSLSDATIPNISMDANGLITWLAEDMTNYGGYMAFTITASDQQGNNREANTIGLTVCVPPEHWSATYGYCQRPVQ